MATDSELGNFLRMSRARIRPEDVGLRIGPDRVLVSGRRVPGLRRQEVAQLAGVSVDYYARLEQGRSGAVGGAVQRAIADALRLNDVEREYFANLVAAQTPPLRLRPSGDSASLRPGITRMIDSFDRSPAFVLSRGMAIRAMNDLAKELLFDPNSMPQGDRNLAKWIFLAAEARIRYVDWESVAADTAAILRIDVGERPDDPDLTALIGELTIKSDDFRRMWSAHHVYSCTFGSKRFHHPVAGRIDVDYEAFDVPGSPGEKLFVYTTQPGSPSAAAVGRLLLAER